VIYLSIAPYWDRENYVNRSLNILCMALFCAAALAAQPIVIGIYNAGSWAPPGLTNSGIAQGSIFILTGTGLGPAVLQQAESYPLPTTEGLAGTTIQATVGGMTENCILVYTSALQVAAILPSATPVGSGTLKLSYQGASSSMPLQVLKANFGTFTLNEAGSGPGVVTDTSYNPITMINAAHPGQSLILWGTGLGAITGDETEPPSEVNLNTGVQVLVGNQPATVTYGGRSSSPGLDQINFVVPSGIQAGCKTSIAVLVKGVTGNVTTTSIVPDGQTTCSETHGVLTAANLQKAISSGSLSVGFVQLSRIGDTDDTLAAGFGTFSLNSLIRSFGGSIVPSIGSCIAYEIYGDLLVINDPIQATALHTGEELIVQGPNGTKDVDEFATGVYASTLATQPSIFIEPGTFTVGNGSGSSNVGAFSWTETLPAYVTPTNLPASINPSQDLTLTWSGGSNYPLVSIFGISGVPVDLPKSSFVDFVCTAEGSAGTFTVPAAILNLLPGNGYGTVTKKGVDIQVAGVTTQDFSAGGSPGIAAGLMSIYVSSGSVATLQ
jgi:uncharacterized protein (TIGR03437 family)